MMYLKLLPVRKALVVLIILAVYGAVFLATPAKARADDRVNRLPSVTSPSVMYGSQLTISGVVTEMGPNGSLEPSADQTVVTLGNLSAVLVAPEAVQTSAPRALPARYSISIADEHGRIFLQNNNESYPSVAWGYRINSATQAIIASQVYEEGLYWETSRGYSEQNSPHLVADNYFFHGRMTPVYTGDILRYIDYFHFTLSDGRQGVLSIYGEVQLTPSL